MEIDSDIEKDLHCENIFPVNPRGEQHRNLPNSLETGDPAAFSPILDSASKYIFPAMDIAGEMTKMFVVEGHRKDVDVLHFLKSNPQ